MRRRKMTYITISNIDAFRERSLKKQAEDRDKAVQKNKAALNRIR